VGSGNVPLPVKWPGWEGDHSPSSSEGVQTGGAYLQSPVYLHDVVARQRLGKHVPAVMNTHATVGKNVRCVFYVVLVKAIPVTGLGGL
jgi:hypothetical protein